jgi:uncharacterized Tic20 family protein
MNFDVSRWPGQSNWHARDGEAVMFKIAALIWMVLGTTLAGVALIVIVTIPRLFDLGMVLIPIACGAAAILAIPLSYLIARQIAAQTAGR